MSSIGNVWMVSREMEGIAGAGGVKDVTRQLLAAITRRGIQATLVMPHYPLMYQQNPELKNTVLDTGIDLTLHVGSMASGKTTTVHILQTEVVGATVFLVDAPCYADKQGIYVYQPAEAKRNGKQAGTGYEDVFEMNVILQKATLALLKHLGIHPDLIHCQDAHTAFIPALVRTLPEFQSYFADVGTGITIHNAGPGYHQEMYDLDAAQTLTGLDRSIIEQGEHRKAVYPFIVGGMYADFINTVSENYAREIMDAPEDDEQTVGIGSAFRARRIKLVGVTNGIDPDEYDPTQPRKVGITAAYDPLSGDLAGKKECRRTLIAEINEAQEPDVSVYGYLEDGPQRPLITMISRLTAQKGVDVFIDAIECLLGEARLSETVGEDPSADSDMFFLILGAGNTGYQEALIELANRFNGRVAVAIGYGPSLANRIYAGGDFFVNPAAFEPCGLTDYMAQLMGSVPVVHLVGGLVKVQDGVTGYGYQEHSPRILAATLRRAVHVFHNQPEKHVQIVQQAVRTIFERYTWDEVLQRGYLPLYEQSIRT